MVRGLLVGGYVAETSRRMCLGGGERGIHVEDVVRPSFDGMPHIFSCAVAEFDFIKAASGYDFEGLGVVFGFVWVSSDIYSEAASFLESKGVDAALLVPAEADPTSIYSAVEIASRKGGMVFSDSWNVRRICVERGVACMGLAKWRMLAPMVC